MSIRQGAETGLTAEVLARADRLLAASRRVSSVAAFAPLSLAQAGKLAGQTAQTDKEPENGIQEAGQTSGGRQDSAELKARAGKSEAGDQIRVGLEERRSLRSEVHPRRSGFKLQADDLSDIPDGADIGLHVFVSYFLHAIEIERLIAINKDQLTEAVEMEQEIEQSEALYQTASQALAKTQEELCTVREQNEAHRREQAAGFEKIRHELNEKLLKEQETVIELKNRHAEELQLHQELFNHRLQEALVQHIKETSAAETSHEEKYKAIMAEAEQRFAQEKESVKASYDERLQREVGGLYDRLQAQFNQDLEAMRRQEEEKFDNQKKIIIKELRDNHEHEKQSLEVKLKADKDKEIATLQETIRVLEDQLLHKDKEIIERKNKMQLAPIETDRGSVDINFGSEIASPREYSRKKSEHRDFFSPNNSVINPTASQKILKAQKYQPLLTSSKLREKERSSTFEARSAGYAENDREREFLDFDNQATDFTKPPYTTPQIDAGSSKRTNGPGIQYQPKPSYSQGRETHVGSLPSKLPCLSELPNPYKLPGCETDANQNVKESIVDHQIQFPASYSNTNQVPVNRGYSFGDQAPTLSHYLNYSSQLHSSSNRYDVTRTLEKSLSIANYNDNPSSRDVASRYPFVQNLIHRGDELAGNPSAQYSSGLKYHSNLLTSSITPNTWVGTRLLNSVSAVNTEPSRQRSTVGVASRTGNAPIIATHLAGSTTASRAQPVSRNVPLAPGSISTYAASRLHRSSYHKGRLE